MRKNDIYFQRNSVLEYIIIIGGFAMLIFLVEHPEPKIYLGSLGIPGEALLYLHENYHNVLYYIMILAIIIHIVETLVCIKVACELDMTLFTILKWTFQTILLGGFSLLKIIRYKRSTFDKTK